MPTVYKTGHEIADTVANSFIKLGYKEHNLQLNRQSEHSDCHIAYGILRGTAEVFYKARNNKQKFIFLDKGFLKPNHFEGYYRLGINHFQQPYEIHAFDEDRLDLIMGREPLELEQYKGENILVIPPSEAVSDFYSLGSPRIWLQNVLADIAETTERPVIVRYKSSRTPLHEHLRIANCVVTNTSSIAWQALRHGIPAISDPKGIIHGWNELKIRDIDSNNMQVGNIRRLFSYMAQYQFTLAEIEQGKAKHLIEGMVQ